MKPRTHLRKPTAERFWAKVQKTDGCWLWTAKRDADGYGRFWDGTYMPSGHGRMVGAHQFSHAIATGIERGGLCVLHRCDNPPCVNPDHLYLGTVADNSRDMIARGRQGTKPYDPEFCGERVGVSKLTTDQVMEIKAAGPEIQNSQLATRFGVRATTVSQVRRGDSWKHIPVTGGLPVRTAAHNAKIAMALAGNTNALGWRHTEESRAKIAASWNRRRAHGC